MSAVHLVGYLGVTFALLVVTVQSASRAPRITRQPKPNIYFELYVPFELPCVAEGNPPPLYHWKRNGVEFKDNDSMMKPNSGSLMIYDPHEVHEGIYQCFATNQLGVSVSRSIDVRMAKMEPFPRHRDVTHTRALGLPYTLQCIPPRSVPMGNVSWAITSEDDFDYQYVQYDDRVSMDKEGHLHFANVRKEDEQNGKAYICMVSNSVLRARMMSHLHYIKVQGRNQDIQPNIMWSDPIDSLAVAGDTYRLQCIFSGNPTPTISWERTDEKMSANAELGRFSQELIFDPIQPEDAGSYTCRATNGMGQAVSRRFDLKVAQRPFFIKEPMGVETEPGADVEFECLGGGNPAVTTQWTINGLQLTDPIITSKYTFSQELTKLYFPDLKDTDQLVVQCNVSNKFGYVFANAFLSVLAKAPEIIAPSKDNVVSAEGLDVNLTCMARGKPDPIITWKKDGYVIVTGGRFKIFLDGTLQIKSNVLNDMGNYTCEAVNGHGSVHGSVRLAVRRNTRIVQMPRDSDITAGKDAKFTCSGTTDPEEVNKLRVYWLKNGERILANDQRTTPTLTISGAIVRDSGTYTCVATNGIDSAKASAVLTVRDRPDPPSNVHQLECKYRNAVIEWTPGSHNNAPLEYYILQYNTSFNPDQWTFAARVDPTVTEYRFLPLSAGVVYNFRLIAVNMLGQSDPSTPTLRVCGTMPDRPSYNPKNLRTSGHKRNTLYIEWTPVPLIDQNAHGFGYRLSISPVGNNNNGMDFRIISDPTVSHYEYATYSAYTPYQIAITSFNVRGESPDHPSTIIGRSFEDTPVIVPTNFAVVEEGNSVVVFSWKFPRSEIDKDDTKIRGEFMGFLIQFWQQNSKEDTLQDYHVTPDMLTNQTGNVFSSRVGNLTESNYFTATISVRNHFYTGPPSEKVQFNTFGDLPDPVSYFEVSSYGDSHASLKWGLPVVNREDVTGYDITYQTVDGSELGEVRDRQPQIDGASTTSCLLSGLEPQRKYRVYIYARTVNVRGEGRFVEFVTSQPVKATSDPTDSDESCQPPAKDLLARMLLYMRFLKVSIMISMYENDLKE